MAFSKKTGEETFFNLLPRNVADEFLRESYTYDSDRLALLNKHFAYQTTQGQKAALERLGISLSPFTRETHSHPASKMIENHILCNVMPGLINDKKNIIFLSIKPHKAHYLFNWRRKMKESQIDVLNKIYEVKDNARYHNCTITSRGMNCFDHSAEILGNLIKNPDTIFMHDELHYWTFDQTCKFLKETSPNNFFATVIFPSEILAGINKSLHPRLYDFEIIHDYIAFKPDGMSNEPYYQKLGNIEWLFKCGRIKIDEDNFYTISRIQSFGAHHIFLFSKGNFSTEPMRMFGNTDFLDPRTIPRLGLNHESFLNGYTPRLRKWVLDKVSTYLMCLLKKNSESGTAKYRQLADAELFSDESILMSELSDLISKYDLRKKPDSLIDLLLSPFKTFKKILSIDSILNKLGLFDEDDLIDGLKNLLINSKEFTHTIIVDQEAVVYKGCPSKDFLSWKKKTESVFESVGKKIPDPLLEYFNSSKQEHVHCPYTVEPESFDIFNGLVNRSTASDPDYDMEFNCSSCSFFLKANLNCPRCEIKMIEYPIPDVDVFSVESLSEDELVHEVPIKMTCHKQICKFNERLNEEINCSVGWKSFFQAVLIAFDVKSGINSLINLYKGLMGVSNLNQLSEITPSDAVTFLQKAGFTTCIHGDELHSSFGEKFPYGWCLKYANGVYSVLSHSSHGVKGRIDSKQDESCSRHESSDKVNDCFFQAVGKSIKKEPEVLIKKVLSAEGCRFSSLILNDQPLGMNAMEEFCQILGLRVHIHYSNSIFKLNDNEELRVILIGGKPGHLFYIQDTELPEYNAGIKSNIDLIYENLYGVKCESPDSFDLDVNGANNLFKSLKSMNTGALIDKEKIKKNQLISEDDQAFLDSGSQFNVKCKVYPFIGFAGSGKTKGIIDLIKKGDSLPSWTFITARKDVLKQTMDQVSEWRKDNPAAKDRKFMTYETALISRINTECIILDELSQFPNGYVDLLLFKLKRHNLNCAQILIVSGDPMQASYHTDSDSRVSSTKPCLKRVMDLFNYKLPYLNYTFRFGQTPGFISLGAYGKHNSSVKNVQGIDRVKIDTLSEGLSGTFGYLCTSHYDVNNLRSEFPEIKTVGQSQGSTYDHVFLLVTEDFLKLSKDHLVVALTRHRYNLMICISDAVLSKLESMKGLEKSNLQILKKDFSQIDCFIQMKLGSLSPVNTPLFGHDAEIKCEGDPFLKSMLTLTESVKPDEIEVKEPMDKVKIKTHVAFATPNFVNNLIDEKMKARENREFTEYKYGWSSQFKDIPFSRDLPSYSSPSLPEAIFPRHYADDSITFWKACKKRLVMKSANANLNDLREDKSGAEILKVFLDKVKLDPTVDLQMYEECINEFESKKLGKNAGTIASHHFRSMPDWNKEDIFLFMKSQLCTKKEKMFCDAKAGQTLACFSHEVLVHFAPMARYIERKVAQVLPKNYYIHQKKNFDELEKWVLQNDFSGVCTESDYEAYDASQDSITLAFEVELMKYLRIDQSMINDYIYMKCNLHSKLGHLAIMRFTGEFCTFLFNTLTNMAFTFMKYDVRNEAIAFAGDDMCANRRLVESKRYSHILDRMSLKAKVDYTQNPTFCGWRLSRYGIVKDPILIATRLEVAKQKQMVHEVIDSYFLEFFFAYQKGDLLFDILKDDELSAHYLLTRFFIENKGKLKGSSAEKMCEALRPDGMFFGEFGSESLHAAYTSARAIFISTPIHKPSCNVRVGPSVMSKVVNGYKGATTGFNFKLLSEMRNSLNGHFIGSFELLEIQNQKERKERQEGFMAELTNRKRKEMQDMIDGIIRARRNQARSDWVKLNVERCQLLISRSLRQLSRMILSVPSLIQYSLGNYMVMQQLLTRKLWIQLKDFKVLSRFHHVFQKVTSPLVSMSWTTMKLSSYVVRGRLMGISTLGQCSYQSLHCILKSSQSLAEWCTLMAGCYVKRMLPRLLSILLWPANKLILSTSQITSCQLETVTSKLHPDSKSNLMMSPLEPALMHSQLMLELCTDLQRVQSWMTSKVSQLEGSIKHLLELNFCQRPSSTSPMMILRIAQMLNLLRMGMISEEKKETFLPQRRQTQESINTGSKDWKGMRDLLGQPPSVLISNIQNLCLEGHHHISSQVNSLLEMSILHSLRTSIKMEICNLLWGMLDPTNALGLSAIPARAAIGDQPAQAAVNPTQAQLMTRSIILNHYLNYLYGNIAILGASASTEMPITPLDVPRPNIENLPQTEILPMQINLSNFVTAVKALAALHANHDIAKMTFRQLCEPFADNAFTFLHDHPQFETNIYSKNPGNYFKCPEVVFDFSTGLSSGIKNRKKEYLLAISASNTRLQSREGKRGVFEAQGQLNFNFDA